MSYWRGKRAVITGGSAGLGRAIAATLVEHGARVALVARREAALDEATQELKSRGGEVLTIVGRCDEADRYRATERHRSQRVGRRGYALSLCRPLDARHGVVNFAGRISRAVGNEFLSAVRCVQAFAESLAENHGHVVLIGSLASKVAAGYLGAYPASKFPLAALAQQMRMETDQRGLHTLLVCPGPITRDDEQCARVRDMPGRAPEVPAAAHQAGRRGEGAA